MLLRVLHIYLHQTRSCGELDKTSIKGCCIYNLEWNIEVLKWLHLSYVVQVFLEAINRSPSSVGSCSRVVVLCWVCRAVPCRAVLGRTVPCCAVLLKEELFVDRFCWKSVIIRKFYFDKHFVHVLFFLDSCLNFGDSQQSVIFFICVPLNSKI